MHRCAPVRIGAQDGVPVFELHAQREGVARDRGVVHEDVEAPECCEHLLEAGFHLRRVGDVHRHGQRRASPRFDFRDQRGKFFRIARGNSDFSARFSKHQRSGASDPLRRTGNESDFIFERKHRLRSYLIRG